MAAKSTVGDFVRDARLGQAGDRLAAQLDRLAGKEIGSGGVAFLRHVDDMQRVIEPWVPIHLLPIAYESGAPVGLHVRPADVDAGRISVLLGIGSTALSAIAMSLEAFVFRAVARVEAEVNDGDAETDELDAAIKVAASVYGREFYAPGWKEGFGVDDLEDVMVERFGGSPHDFSVLAGPVPAVDEKLEILRRGLMTDPAWLDLHAQCAKLLADRKDWNSAADEAAASLACYYHTAAVTDTGQHVTFCRDLVGKSSGPHRERLQAALPPEAPQERLERVSALVDERKLVEAEKALADLCYDLSDYISTLEAFERLYAKLEWAWGTALCGLRR